jgi:chemotaxis protein MotA
VIVVARFIAQRFDLTSKSVLTKSIGERGLSHFMLVIVGALLVVACVVGGYLSEGGHMAVLVQPVEIIIIMGSAIGGLLISSSPAFLKTMFGMVFHSMKFKETTKEQYLEVLLCMYELFKTGKGNMLSLEAHVEKPEESAIFKKYPFVVSNHHALFFIADTLKVQISSPVSPYDLDDLMSQDLESVHKEELKVPAAVSRVGDAMPGLGIVAAVLGVVITMGKLTQGKEVIGHSVAAALVGTFMGVLLSYGFFQPLAAKLETMIGEEGKVMDVIKAGLLAFGKECSPKVCIEFARRIIPAQGRPSFDETDKATQTVKAAA